MGMDTTDSYGEPWRLNPIRLGEAGSVMHFRPICVAKAPR